MFAKYPQVARSLLLEPLRGSISMRPYSPTLPDTCRSPILTVAAACLTMQVGGPVGTLVGALVGALVETLIETLIETLVGTPVGIPVEDPVRDAR